MELYNHKNSTHHGLSIFVPKKKQKTVISGNDQYTRVGVLCKSVRGSFQFDFGGT